MSYKDDLIEYMKKEIKRLKDDVDQAQQGEQLIEMYSPETSELGVRIEKLEQYFKDILNVTRQSSSLKMTVASITDICIIALGKPKGGDTSANTNATT